MDSTTTSEKISAIISNEEELEIIITQLISESVARSDISIQGSAEQIKEKYGSCFVTPEQIQESKNPPLVDPYLNDDYGWIVGFSFALPLFLCLIIAIFIIGDIRSTYDIWLYGTLGLIVGSGIGYYLAKRVKENRENRIVKQEEKGGFVLWVTTHSKKQHQQVIKILKKHHPQNIKD